MTRYSVRELMGMEFPPLRWVVPGIVPEGMSILASPPKAGKSWLCLDLAYQLANGGQALAALEVGDPRPVLYLALEDGPRRIQDRLCQLDDLDLPDGLYFDHDASNVLATIGAFLTEHATAAPVIVLDTLGKVAPPALPGENDYARDYRVGGSLKHLVDGVPGAALIAVHHTRKAASDDFLETVSGTNGLAGSADTVLVLRRDRNSPDGSLAVTSRDADEGEHAVHRVDAKWHLTGGSLAASSLALTTKRAAAGLGQDSARIVAYVNERPHGVRAADVVAAMPDLLPNTVRRTLARAEAAGRVAKHGRGTYIPVPSVASVPLSSLDFATDKTHGTPPLGDTEHTHPNERLTNARY